MQGAIKAVRRIDWDGGKATTLPPLAFRSNRRADEALIAEMQRFARGEAFDERAMPELDSEAVSFRAASESFTAVRRPLRSVRRS